MRSIVEDLSNGAAVKQQLGQRLLADLVPGPVQQARHASCTRVAALRMPSQPGNQARQAQQYLTHSGDVARWPFTSTQAAQW